MARRRKWRARRQHRQGQQTLQFNQTRSDRSFKARCRRQRPTPPEPPGNSQRPIRRPPPYAEQDDAELAALQRLAEVEQWATATSRQCAANPFDASSEYRADCISVAWEIAKASRCKWPPPTIMRIAKRRVAQGMQFEHRAVSLGEVLDFETTAEFQLEDLFSEQLNPARIVCFCVDFCEWLRSLSGWDWAVAVKLRNGDTVAEVARKFNTSFEAIRNTRDALFRHWVDFFSDSFATA